MDKSITSVDAYISTAPEQAQQYLIQMRQLLNDLISEATEVIGYGIPTYRLNGRNIAHFGGYSSHIGFYPGSGPIEAFGEQLKAYKTSKGTVQFPLDMPLPTSLIAEMVRYSLNIASKKAGGNKSGKTTTGEFQSILSKPAQRALANAGITTLAGLTRFTEQQILTLHGLGPSSVPKLREALTAAGLAFRGEQ